ncbi:MAG TPA: SCO family protein [Blastocatellia bacterium]|jgi:protein SCO1/2|nr:SCO family protein [Blastocatellia bacterium]
MKSKFLLYSLLIFGLIVSACSSMSRTPESKSPEASSAAKRYEVKGKVVSADKADHKVTIAHEEIKGYMEAMTMPFTLLEDWVYPELKPGAQIQATLVVDQGRTWLENPVVSNVVDPSLAGKAEESGVEPAAGTETPDFTLVNQDGKKVSFKQYRGKALVMTFIYTRCPLPDYCPLMTQNFVTINRELQNNPALRDKARLLSVTLDPDYDKPNVLRDYGAHRAGADKDGFKRWEFATGSPEQIKSVAKFFGLNYWKEKDQVIHGLRTAIITPDGKVAKVYRGNDWKPEDLVKDLEKLGKRE